MRIVVDALSATNLSARRVLLGHLNAITRAHKCRHSFTILHHRGNQDLVRNLGSHVHWHRCPAITQHWTGRLLWQIGALPTLLRNSHANLLINPNGSLTPFSHLPQVVLAQNPWCFVPALQHSPAAQLKATLQRRAYRTAQRQARALFCNSQYLRSLYSANAHGLTRPEPLLYNGIDDAIFTAAAAPTPLQERAMEVLAVSVMAPHKAIEALVEAQAILVARGVHAQLRLVGPWADPRYRASIVRRIHDLRLERWVSIHGGVSESELHRFYRQARVFALLSRCESFGLPAVEAQAFGTPSVVADVGAPPEIAGPGALLVPPDDPQATAAALETLLTDADTWSTLSARAQANAARFRWQLVSEPLVEWLQCPESNAMSNERSETLSSPKDST